MDWKLKYALIALSLGFSMLAMNVILHEVTFASLLGYTSSSALIALGLVDLSSYIGEKRNDRNKI